jgi:transposase
MVTLSQRETQHLMVLNALERSELTVADAAKLLGRSVRQTQRLRAAYRARGPAALVHANRGRASPRRVADAIRARVIQLARTIYARVNFQHFSELLAEREGIRLSPPTIHRLLTADGIRSPRTRRRAKHRQRRDRFPQAGMLMQMDGSHQAWLEDRGPRLTLLHAVDDTTGTVVGAVFRQQEDATGYLLLLRQVTTAYGLPLAVYTDRHGIFKRAPIPQRPLTVEEQLKGGPAPTQVGRALQEMGIQWIPASSPQAKGRIERQGGTFQDRLVAELRLAGIATIEAAAAFLPSFLQRVNARFAKPPAQPESAYRPWPSGVDPNTVFCFKYLATVANDNTLSLGPHQLQILPGSGGRSYAKARVEVHERLDGTLAVYYHGQRLPARPLAVTAEQPLRARHRQRIHPHGSGGGIQISLPPHKTRPGGNGETWRRAAAEGKRQNELKKTGVTFSLNR